MSIQRSQSGFALLLFVLVLMGLGGIALTGSMELMRKGIEQEKHDHNVRILNEAKQALLYYAYNYPNFNAQGPGHLPCPYDEIPGGIPGYSSVLTVAICTSVGRLPFDDANLNFNEVKDADGEHLWYAVSDNFYNLPPGVDINSDTVGTISVFDQSGNLVYDGASNGIAAIIIAPGKAMARDDDGDEVYDYTQVRATDAEKANPKNYLDAFNGFDNSNFINIGNANSDGFRLGPTFGTTKHEIVMNDQMVLITTAEIIEVAEKSVLDQYATVLDDYHSKTGTYPWLFDFNLTLGQLNADVYPAASVLTNIGRIPSTFSTYFTIDTSIPMVSEVSLIIEKAFNVTGANEFKLLNVISDVTTNVSFESSTAPVLLAPIIPRSLKATSTGAVYRSTPTFYWFNAGWIRCDVVGVANGADDIDDCDDDIVAPPGVGFPARILRVELNFDMATNPFEIKLDYQTAPVINYIAATATNHARINATFTENRIINLPSKLLYEEMNSYTPSIPSIPPLPAVAFAADSSVDQDIMDNTDFGYVTGQSISGGVTIGVRYYPELPTWAAASNENWHKSIIMAIAPDYQPGVIPPNSNCVAVPPCLTLDRVDTNVNKASLLIMAGQNDYVDDDGLGLSNDVVDVFDAENANFDTIFSTRSGNDRIHIIQEN